MVGLGSVFLHSPNKGFWAFLGIYLQACPHVQRLGCFCSKVVQLSSGRIFPRVTIAKGNSIHLRVRHNIKQSIAGCFN